MPMLDWFRNLFATRQKHSLPDLAAFYEASDRLLAAVEKDLGSRAAIKFFESLIFQYLQDLMKQIQDLQIVKVSFENNRYKIESLPVGSSAQHLDLKNILRISDTEPVRRVRREEFLLLPDQKLVGGLNIREALVVHLTTGEVYFLHFRNLHPETENLVLFLEFYFKGLRTKLKQNLRLNELDQFSRDLRKNLDENIRHLRETERSLKKRSYEIHNILEISNELYSILNVNQLINSALLTIVGQLGCQKVFAVLYDPLTRKYSRKFMKGFNKEDHIVFEFEVDHPLAAFFAEQHSGLTTDRLGNEPGLETAARLFEKYGVEQVAPIYYSDRVKGIVGVGSKLHGQPLDYADQEMFSILINIISISLSNAQTYEDVKQMSFTDAMTNLNNYRYFEDRLNEELFRAQRNKGDVGLIMIDIDFFKNYNDTLGHQAGDDALRALSMVLKNTVREDDIVNRYGGEEFCIIMPGMAKSVMYIMAERIRENVEKHVFYKEHVQPAGKLTISLGGASYPMDARDFDGLVHCSDKALYASKKNGRNRFTLYDVNFENN